VVNPAEPTMADLVKNPAFDKFKTADGTALDAMKIAKSYQELQTQLGKPRFDVPAADAPPEVQAEFYKKMGVPEKPDGYGLKAPDGYPEHMGEYMGETLTEFSAKAHELKMTPAQAAGVQAWFDGHALKLGAAQQTVEAQKVTEANGRLDAHMTSLFGDQKNAQAARVTAIMTEAIPDPALRADLEKALPVEALTAIAAIEKHYRTKYGLPDTTIGDTGNASGKSLADMRTEASALMATPAYRDPMHKDHKTTRAQADGMYKQIGQLTEQAKKK